MVKLNKKNIKKVTNELKLPTKLISPIQRDNKSILNNLSQTIDNTVLSDNYKSLITSKTIHDDVTFIGYVPPPVHYHMTILQSKTISDDDVTFIGFVPPPCDYDMRINQSKTISDDDVTFIGFVPPPVDYDMRLIQSKTISNNFYLFSSSKN